MNYVYIVFGVILLSAIGIGGFKAGENHVQVEFDKYRQVQNDVLAKANEDALKKQNELQARSDKVAESASISIKAVRDYYANHPTIVYRSSGVQSFTSSTGSGGIKLPQSATATSGIDGQASNNGYLTQVIDPDLVARCADTTIRFLGLQEWARKISQ